jgi:hypothetical protein
MKGRFGRESFKTGGRLLSAAERGFACLEKRTLTKVFLEWMRRLEQYVETHSDYVA